MDRAGREHWALIALDLGVDAGTPAGEVRTKDALHQKRVQGVTLGMPSTMPTKVVSRIVTERAAGASLSDIAAGLDRDEVATSQSGRAWYSATVRKAWTGAAARAVTAMALTETNDDDATLSGAGTAGSPPPRAPGPY